MTDLPDDLRELYFEFGRAAEMAQLMETEAGNLALVYATMFVNTSKINEEERKVFQALVQDVNRRTFGNLFREIQRNVQLDNNILDTVSDALEKRNYLTHRFFRIHNFAIHSVEGRRAMITEIQELQRSLSLAHSMLSAMTGSLEQVLSQLFGRNMLSEQEALNLMAVGKRVDI